MSPHRAYYRACVGAWRGRFELTVTDERALRDAPLSLADRMRFFMMRLAIRLFGAPGFATSVSLEGESAVIHTTRIFQFGMPWFVSRERITLDPDGERGSITITDRLLPLFVPARVTGPFPVKVEADARHASYELVFLGCPMKQTGEIVDDDHVTLVQTTAFSRSVQRLARVR